MTFCKKNSRTFDTFIRIFYRKNYRRVMTPKQYIYVFLTTVFCAYLFLRESYNENEFNSSSEVLVISEKENYPKSRKNWKQILFWTDFFFERNVWHSVFKRLTAGECKESRCEIIFDRAQLQTVDAVLFNAFNLRNKNNTPSFMKGNVHELPNMEARSLDQIYIFYSMEPPQKLDKKYLASIPSNYFNWTMGYRRDSDVYEPFGRVTRKSFLASRNTVRSITAEELKKKKFAIWIASSCYKFTPFLREKFIETFKRIMPVDIYGQCGKSCDNYKGINIYGNNLGSSPCDEHVKNYAFYLSLENSLCNDYVTEKIFKAWSLGVIPVVFGGADYSAFAPPKSYIDYRDFNSISDLIKYMKIVGSNHTLYNEYLEWQKDYDVDVGSPYKPFVCDLCEKLRRHISNRSRKSYHSIYDWFVLGAKCKEDLELVKLS